MTGLAWSAASAAARLAVGFLIFAVLAHHVSTAEFGQIAYFYTISLVFSLFVDYGFNLRLSRDAVHGGAVREKAIVESIAVKAVHFLTALLLFSIWKSTADGYMLGLLFLIAAFLNVLGSTLFPLLRADGFYREETSEVVANNTVVFIAFIAMVLSDRLSFYAFPLALIVGKAYLVARFVVYARRSKLPFPTIRDYRHGSSGTATFFVHAMAAYLFWNLDTLVLKEFVAFDVVGRYQAAIRVLVGITFATDVLNNFFIPHIMRNGFEAEGGVRLQYHLTLFVGLLAGSVLFAMAGWAVFMSGMEIIFGADYRLESVVIVLLSMVVFLRYFGIYFGILLTILDAQKIRMYAGLIGIVSSSGLLFLFVPRYGMVGAAIANFGAHVVVNAIYVFVSLIILRRHGTSRPGGLQVEEP